MTNDRLRSPASRVMNEAMELAIAESYLIQKPRCSSMLIPPTPSGNCRGFDKGLAAVVVSADGNVGCHPDRGCSELEAFQS